MSEQDFFDCTPRFFAMRRRSWLENRNGMEEARFVAFHVLKAGGFKIRRLTQIAKFPWDVVERRVKLEAWDSPAMLKFSEEADRALAVLNPKAYEEYMAGKRNPSPGPSPEGRGDVDQRDPELSESFKLSESSVQTLTIEDELTL